MYGVRCGYRGFYSDNLEPLTPELVEHIHMQASPWVGLVEPNEVALVRACCMRLRRLQ